MIDLMTYWLEWFLILWLGLLAFLVAKSMFNPHAPRYGLLSGGGNGFIDPERLPLFLVTVGFALYYTVDTLMMSLDDLERGPGEFWMPEVPQEMLYVLFGAQASFLTGKVFRLFQLRGTN